MPYIGRAPTASITKLEDADQDTKIQVEESSDEDIIRFDIAGAEDFTMTANTLNVLSGSTLNINSGATIANSGTATGFTDLTAIADGSAGSPSIANTGDTNTGIYFPAADTVGMVTGGTEQFRFGSNPIPGGSKNLVQNGNFTVAQRGTTVTSPANGDYLPTDRWKNWQTTGGAVEVTKDTSGVFAAFGTDTAMKIDVTTAESSVAAGDYFVVTHPIEAQNLQHLKYGLAGAEAITVSFCFQSPKSGTHYVAIYQADGNRYIWRPFTVTSADTAEYFSLTFAGDTSGTINNDTGIGFNLYFPLMAGTDSEGGSDNTWASGAKYGAATMQNLLDNTANNIYIGLVQMEVGSVATDFEFEDYGTTLSKCHRYLQYWGPVANAEFDRQGAYAWKANTADGVNAVYIMVDLDAKARMRGTPTFTTSGVGATNWKLYTGTRSLDVITVMSGAGLANATTSGLVSIYIAATGTDFTVGSPVMLVAGTSGSAFYYFSAELQL